MLKGCLVALITPMQEDGSIDFPSLRELVDWHIEAGIDGLVAVGTSGEAPTLSVDEHIEVVRVVVEQADRRVPVLAGTGSNSTKDAVHLSKQADRVGAQYGLSVTPYYNKPTQEGLFLHYKAIVEESGFPTILYNVPNRTATDLSNEIVLQLVYACPEKVVGLKDASTQLARCADLLAHLPAHLNFSLFSGDDSTALPLMSRGAHGVISVTANVAPKLVRTMCTAALNHELKVASEINAQLEILHRSLFVETNPIPTKWALNKMKRIPAGIRPPLTWLSQTSQALVEGALQTVGLL